MDNNNYHQKDYINRKNFKNEKILKINCKSYINKN